MRLRLRSVSRWIVALAVGLVAALPHGARAQSQGVIRDPTVAEQYLQAAADQERAALHLPPLRRDPALVRAAYTHALRMAGRNAISHQFADEPDLAERGAAAGGRFSLISENVGEGPAPIGIEEAWIHSPHHRANLLDPRVDAVGISVVVRGHQLFAVEDFAHTVRRLSLDQQEVAIAQLLEREGLSIVAPDTDARKTCALESGYVGRQPLFVMRFTTAGLDQLPATLNDHVATGKYSEAAVGACEVAGGGSFTAYNLAVLLYR